MKPYLTIVAVTLVSAAAQAEPVAAFVTEQINVSHDDGLAIAAVCSERYGMAVNQAVAPPERASQLLADNQGNVAAAAQALGATDLLDLRLVRLGPGPNAHILVEIRRTSPGSPPRSASLELASLEDAPAACDRLTRSLVTGVSVDDDRDRTNVTRAEAVATSSPARLGTERTAWVKFSLGTPLESGYQPIGSGRIGANFESDRYMIETGLGFIMPSFYGSAVGYGGLVVELGASYFLTESSNTVFVGAGLEPRINFGGAVLELAPYAQVGAMVGRDTSVRGFLELRLAQNLLPVASEGANVGTQLPTELSVYAGVGF